MDFEIELFCPLFSSTDSGSHGTRPLSRVVRLTKLVPVRGSSESVLICISPNACHGHLGPDPDPVALF